MEKSTSSLETPRLLLRPFEAGDVAAYAAIRSKPEVIRFLPGGVERARHANDVASQIVTDFAMPWRERAGYAPWAVITKSDGLLRGHLGLRVLAEEGGRTELLYMLDSAVWGHGLATEGALATRDFAFDQLHLRHIIAMALPENTASMRVMVKIGMVREPGLVKAFGLDVVRFNLAAPLDMA